MEFDDKEPDKPSSPPRECREELSINYEENSVLNWSGRRLSGGFNSSNMPDFMTSVNTIVSAVSTNNVENVRYFLDENQSQSKDTGKIHFDIEKKSNNNNTDDKEDCIEDKTNSFINTGTGVPKEISKVDTDGLENSSSISLESTSKEVLNIEFDKDDYTEEKSLYQEVKEKVKVVFFTEETEPQWYEVKSNLVTAPMITGNLPKVFQSLPVVGRPNSKDDIEDFQLDKIREFVGCNLDDEEFHELAKYCSPMHLKIGKELTMSSNVPTTGHPPITTDIEDNIQGPEIDSNVEELCTVTKCKLRERDFEFRKKLKYRGVRLIPLMHEEENCDADDVSTVSEVPDEHPPLEPGKDILYRVRVYRPFVYNANSERNIKIRHSVFSCDCVLLGRDSLTTLRDRFVCHNETDMRVDVSTTPDDLPMTTAKEIFPSGFLFINNVFYVDSRAGCADLSAPLRAWARRRGLGLYRRRDMAAVRLHQLVLKLGHPEVYVHQGNCEHLFTFSEIRLLGPSDPLSPSYYPCHTAISQNQSIYCTTCAEFSAKWVVVGCNRVPFDPAFFCDTCFKLYLYKDGVKIGDFKAFSYRGNEINMLKPMG